MEPDKFAARMRAESSRLYSSLSKGIHHEFVIPPAALYDRATVSSLLADALRLSSHLCMLTHHVAHVPFNLDAVDALASYNEIETIEVT
jgi:hypothetical protein